MKHLNWKIVVLACTAMLCGTALYIDSNMRSKLQQRAGNINNPTVRQVPDFKTLVPVAPKTFTFKEASQPLPVATHTKTPDLFDQAAASAIIERAQRQQRWNSMQAQFQVMNQQATLDDIEFDLESQQLQPAPQPVLPTRNNWMLKYNGFNNTWRYAPMNSSLLYNPFGNDWEFVPQD